MRDVEVGEKREFDLPDANHKRRTSNHVLFSTYQKRSFPSSCLPPLQSESKCDVFVMVIGSTLHMNEN